MDETSRSDATIVHGPGYRPGRLIAGRYKLLEPIGEGGMGTVWVAEQAAPVKRRVAVKLIKPGMDSRQVVSRFEAERQALALMDHPNIAKVYDGGMTDEGRPFFVMEYVRGISITEYCDRAKLSIADRLKLLIPVCHAIQHAHQKGIIHRDLKPSNVLVCLYDGEAVPKVIDFGLAKAMTQPLTEHTLYTAHGMMVGTPAYMSPEQAEFNNLDIDTRTDIYSLGVILYELITGSTPLERQRFKDAAWHEVLRLIKEVEPPKPSTRLSTVADVATVASERGTEPAQLSRLIKGDLDWIVMKSLEKERSRRYETPNSLAQDIERYLKHETVLACPPSAAYRFKKLIQRNRAAVYSAAAIALCLLLGTVVSAVLAIHATSQRNLAQQRFVEAQEARAAAEKDRDLATRANAAEQAERQRAEEQRQLAVEQKRVAEEQRQFADQQRQAVEVARQAEAAQRQEAERERDRAQTLNEALERQQERQRRSLYTAEINLIQKAWDAENLVRVSELLHATRPKPGEADLRGFEWHYWQRLAHRDLSSLKFAGAAGTTAVLFSENGQLFAAIESYYLNGGTRHRLRVWDLPTGKELLVKDLQFDEGSISRTVNSVYVPARFMRDYRLSLLDDHRVAVVRIDRPSWNSQSSFLEYSRNTRQTVQLCVYRLRDGEQSFTLETTVGLNTSRAAESFVFSRDGTKIVSLTSPEQARLWDGESGSLEREVLLPRSALESSALGFSANGSLLAYVAAPPSTSETLLPTVRVPFWGELKLPWPGLAEIQLNRAIQVLNLESGATKEIAVGQKTGTAAAINVLAGTSQAITVPMPVSVSHLRFNNDGNRLVGLISSGAQSSARIWSTVSGDEVCRISDAMTNSSVSKAVFSPDNTWLATTSRLGQLDGKSIRLWDAVTGRPAMEFKGHASAVTTFAFDSDGKSLVSADRSGQVKSWGVPALSSPVLPAYQLQARSPDGMWTAAQTFSPFSDPKISLFHETKEGTGPSLAITGNLSFCAFSPDSQFLLVASYQRNSGSDAKSSQLVLYEVATGKKRWSHEFDAYSFNSSTGKTSSVFPGSLEGTAFSPDSRLLAMVSRQTREASKRLLQVWNVSDGQLRGSELILPPAAALRFSPDSQLIAVGEIDTIHPGVRTSNTTYSTAQGTLSIPGYFGGIAIWHVASGKTIVRQGPYIPRVGFSPRGGRIAAIKVGMPTNSSPQLLFWDDQTGEEISTLPLEAGRTYSGLALSADHEHVALVSGNAEGGPREVLILKAANGEKVATLQGHNGAIVGAAFSPNGRRLATSAGLAPLQSSSSFGMNYSTQSALIGETKIWDVESGHELLTLAGGSEELAFFDGTLGPDLAAHVSRLHAGPTWEAGAIRPDVEAADLVEMLIAGETAGRPLSRAELHRRLNQDHSLREEVRLAATEQVRRLRRNPTGLNNAAWTIVREAQGSEQDFARGLDYAEEACENDPNNVVYLNTLGVAHYRLGHFEAAVAKLELCRKLREETKQVPISEDAVFLAMAHHQLGHQADAERFFRFADRGTFQSASNRKLLDEAAALVGLAPATPLLFEGITARQKKDFDTALTVFNQALARDPGHEAVYHNRGSLWNEKKEYEKAIADYNEAIRLFPENAMAHANRAVAWENLRQLDKAEAGFSEALRLDPRNAFSLTRRAGLLRQRGELDAALKDLEDAIRIEPSNPTRYTTRAQIWQQKGDLAKAIASYDEAVRAVPKSPTSYANRGELRRQTGNVDQAINDYNEALKINPKDAGYLNARGNLWRQKPDYEKAISDYSEALGLNPKADLFFANRGRAWQLKGDREKAKQDYDEAIRLNPKRALTFGYRGDLLRLLGEKEAALADYDQALSIDGNYATAYASRGNLHLERGRLDDALADFNEAIRLSPRNAGYYSDRGRTWRQKKEYENAIRDHDEALRLRPETAQYHNNRGFAWYSKGELDWALDDYNAALRIDPKHVTALGNRAIVWKQRGEFTKALSDYDEAIRLNAKQSSAWNGRALLRAACPTEELRNGAMAISDATTACELTQWKNADYLATLAAAYAESGNYQKATEWQQIGMDLATAPAKERLLPRMKLYEAGRPYREP